MYYMFGPPNPEAKSAKPSPLLPALKSEEPSLSELNPLFYPLDLPTPGAVEAFNTVTLRLIDQYGGLRPDVLKSMVVASDDPRIPPEYRFTARFDVRGLTRKKISYIEELVRYTYGKDARTTKSADGVALPAVRYPHADVLSIDEILNTRLEGWYMGPNTTPLDTLHKGVYLFKDVGVTNAKNFLKETRVKRPRFIVEIREADLFQTDLANLVIETSMILGKGGPVDYGQLLYDAYYGLLRMGMKREEEGYHLEGILKPIRRGLLLPLANPELAEAIGQEPESALFAGVPGTGKSLAARKVIHEDTGLFIIPIDPMLVAKDIDKPPEKRQIMPRIAQVRTLSQRPVILQLEDVEKTFDKNNPNTSALLNLMAGVQEQGFYVMASTNEPEQITPALLEPQRLGIRVYCGLPDLQGRLHILAMHTPKTTPDAKTALFSSPETRRIILEYIAQNTENFPPRQLAKIATNAKSILLERVSEKTGKTRGLDEGDLGGLTFSVEDWEEALAKTVETFDKKAIMRRDEEIRKFITHHDKPPMSLHQQVAFKPANGFDEVRRQIAAAESKQGLLL